MQNSPARSSIDVGSVINGTYTIEALIGRGGMGAVFLASHTRLPGKKVAVKVLHAEMEGDEIMARFKREAQIASLLSHPNIVHIEDYNVTAEGMPFLVLEYLQGESLAQCLRRGPLPVSQAFSIIRQVGSALAAAHDKGIVHRDLKPQNIFLVQSVIDGRTTEIAKVLDFGISKMRDSQTVKTQESALLGTPQYMAPEQAMGQHDKVDQRTDIFALGAIVYEMLAGQPAFSGQTIPEVVFKVVYEQPVSLSTRVPTVSDQILATVNRALSKTPDDRYDSVNTFLEALTGAPVSVIRSAPSITPPPASAGFDGTGPTSASGQTPLPASAFQDAFAKTVGSGEHGLSPIAATTAGIAPPVAPVPVDALTVKSHNRPPTAGLGEAATVSAESSGSGSRRTVLVAGGLIGAAVAAAGIMYVVMREPPPAPERPVAREITPPPVVEAAAPPVERALLEAPVGSAHEAGSAEVVPVGSAPTPTAAVPKPKPTRQVPPARTDEPDPDSASDTTGAAPKVRDGLAALASARWSDATQIANTVIGTEGATKKQRAQGTMILGIAACHSNDEETAQRSVRALVGFPALRTRVLKACHAAGWLAGMR